MDIPVMQDILGRNDEIAGKNKSLFDKHGILAINLLGSPGSGKTTLLERTIAHLKDDLRLAVIEGDLFTDKDADRIAQHNVPVIQINTNGGCHLDAPMVEEVLGDLDLDKLDVVIIENVGNLVCPAEFVVGEDMKVTVLSITEGDDKPLKYPLMFSICDVVLINKCDTLSVFDDFSKEAVKERILKLNPDAKIFFVSAKTGEGFDEWADWIRTEISEYQK